MKKIVFIALVIFFTSVNSLLAARFTSSYQEEQSIERVGDIADSEAHKGVLSGLFADNENEHANSATKTNISATGQIQNSTATELTLATVAKHNTKNDCWLVINNKVYDVDSYINKHPGGAQKILDNCGKEVGGLFAAIHSKRAWDLLAKYLVGNVGDVIASTVPAQLQPTSVTTTSSATSQRQTATATKTPTSGNIEYAIQQQFPGAIVQKITAEDDGRSKVELIYNGDLYNVVFNPSYSIKEIEQKDDDWIDNIRTKPNQINRSEFYAVTKSIWF